MSKVSRSFVPVTLRAGCCPNDEHHFRGAAREVYSYLKLLAANNGGFVFASIKNISGHTKKWREKSNHYSLSECKKIIRALRGLRVLGKYETRVIRGRAYRGWQFADHVFWSENIGHICEFKFWSEYDESQLQSSQGFTQQNGPGDGPDYGPNDEPATPQNGPANGPGCEKEFAITM